MGITSEEIAKIARVSRSTVSRVINNYPNVPEKTREKVLKAIEENDYHSNEMARALAGKAGSEIGLFLIEQRYEGIVKAGFTHRLIAELIRVCYENRSALSVYLIRNKKDFQMVRDVYQRRKIGGGLFLGFEYKMNWLEPLILDGYNMVAIDIREEDIRKGTNTGFLNFDNEGAGYLATSHLIAKGRRRILHIAGDQRISSVLRQQGYARAMREAGLEDEVRIREGGFDSGKAVREMLRALKEEQVDGIFAASDRMALNIIYALQNKGVRVPEDIPVVGCDYVEGESGTHDIALTSVLLPQRELVERAVRMLLNKEEKQSYRTKIELVTGGTA